MATLLTDHVWMVLGEIRCLSFKIRHYISLISSSDPRRTLICSHFSFTWSLNGTDPFKKLNWNRVIADLKKKINIGWSKNSFFYLFFPNMRNLRRLLLLSSDSIIWKIWGLWCTKFEENMRKKESERHWRFFFENNDQSRNIRETDDL